jgi:hypothetical protein
MGVFEFSDIYYHKRLNAFLIVGDAGDVFKIDATDYAKFEVWPVTKDGTRNNYDLEGITVADEASDMFYIMDERDAQIFELDLNTKGF